MIKKIILNQHFLWGSSGNEQEIHYIDTSAIRIAENG